MEPPGLLNHYTTLELIKKIKYDNTLWGWRSYISRDISKVQVFIEQFSKEYNVTASNVIIHVNQLWARLLEEIGDIDLLNNESIILSEWKYFKAFDFVIDDLTNVMRIRSELITLLAKYSVLFSPNVNAYVTYLQRSAWSEVAWAMHSKIFLTTHKKAFTRRELKVLYSNFSYKNMDTPQLIQCDAEFSIKRYPVFLHVHTAGNNRLDSPYEGLLDIYEDDDDITPSVVIVEDSNGMQNHKFNPIVVNVDTNVSKLPPTKTIVTNTDMEDHDKEYVKNNVIDKLHSIEKQYLILGIFNNISENHNYVDDNDIGYILLLSLVSIPEVVMSKGRILNGPNSECIWETIAMQLTDIGLNITVRQLDEIWKYMISSTRLKLSLYRMHPDEKDYELSDLDIELTYYFNDLVNGPQKNSIASNTDKRSPLIDDLNTSRLRSGRNKNKAAEYNAIIFKKYKKNSTSPNEKDDGHDSDDTLILDENFDNDSVEELIITDIDNVSDNEDDKPLSVFTAEKKLEREREKELRKIHMINEIKNFRSKNKYALNRKIANINLPNNHWMNWWKNRKPLETPVKVVSKSSCKKSPKGMRGKRRRRSDKGQQSPIKDGIKKTKKLKKSPKISNIISDIPEETLAVFALNNYFQ